MVELREFKTNGASLLQVYLNNPNVTKFLTSSIPQPYGKEDAEWWINEGSEGGIFRAIEYERVFIGSIGRLRRPRGWNR